MTAGMGSMALVDDFWMVMCVRMEIGIHE